MWLYLQFSQKFGMCAAYYVFPGHYIVDAVGSSGIMFKKQKLGVTFNSDKLGGIDFTKFSKLTMCSAGAGRYWLVLEKVYV